MIWRGTNSLPFQTGFIAAFETPRIATSGALMIGVNASAADASER